MCNKIQERREDMIALIKLLITFGITSIFIMLWSFYGARLRDDIDIIKGMISLTIGLILFGLLIGFWVEG